MTCPVFDAKEFCLRENCRYFKNDKCEHERVRTEDREELQVKDKLQGEVKR